MVKKGFTLLELLVVLALITILAGSLLVAIDGTGDQARYNVTEQQYSNIRSAILGNNSVSSTGVVLVNGYIADTGIRPITVSALFINPNTNASTSGTYPDNEFLTDKKLWRNVGTEVAPASWNGGAPPAGLRLKHGWRGPYLNGDYRTDDIDSSTAHFFDSWGNDWDSNYDDDTTNGIPPAGNIVLFSPSKDQIVGNSDLNQYSEDYPSSTTQQTISKDLFQVDLTSVALPSLKIQNDSTDILIVGLIYPGINLNSIMNDPVDVWHESLVKYDGINPIEIPVSAVATPTILNSTSNVTGNFGGHPEAYRYQIAVYKKSVNNTDTLANQIIAVFHDIFIFAPCHSAMTPSVTNISWRIPSP